MINSTEQIRTLLNLRTTESIGVELAERQLSVITKGYQYLSKPENNVFYVADEVGLGKTYIAAGIALLFRHFAQNSSQHKDLIIVPKKNLQYKWQKELNNFVNKNYLGERSFIKEQYASQIVIQHRMAVVNNQCPTNIFRMSSFSGLGTRSRTQKKYIFDHFKDDFFSHYEEYENVIYPFLEKAQQLGLFRESQHRKLRNLVAYLLNVATPQIHCLIVDEAHNYKYGPDQYGQQQSIRNETTTRFLGAVRDEELLKDFPGLEQLIKFPLAEKVICLSATPKDRQLNEIKKQLSCFTNQHILSQATTNQEIEPLLKKFLVRGNLEYILKGETISRNKCNHEHRFGNVDKIENAKPLEIEDNFESVFWQLIQYQSIKHLNQKNNASFEIGMLAGFETYKADIDSKKSRLLQQQEASEEAENASKEYDLTKGNVRESQDINVVRDILNSYVDEYQIPPPHPKQTKLTEEIIKQLKRQEKSLLFARRIATVYELEKRLLEQYEKEVVIQQLTYIQNNSAYASTAVEELINDYHQRAILEKLDDVAMVLIQRKPIEAYMNGENIFDKNQQKRWLKTTYHKRQHTAFVKALEHHIKEQLSNISKKLVAYTIEGLQQSKAIFIQEENDNNQIETEDTSLSGYFFLDYFKKENKGHPYRTKMYREYWFDLNPIQLNQQFNFLNINQTALQQTLPPILYQQKVTKRRKFLDILEQLYERLPAYNQLKKPSSSKQKWSGELGKKTLITTILQTHCSDEMGKWINKRMDKGIDNLVTDLQVLHHILLNIFRNGSGLLLGYVANHAPIGFEQCLDELLSKTNSPFHFVLEEIKTILLDFDLIVQLNFETKKKEQINTILQNLIPVVGASGRHKRNKGILAAQFRMPGFPYVLVTTDIFREGEDLHSYCQHVYHYGVAWNPSDMQQRTGRIDRINSLSYRKLTDHQALEFDHKIQVFYPYLKHSVEVNQVSLLFENLNRFIKTFNNIAEVHRFDSQVSIDEEIDKIPEQITATLHSKYNIKDFVV